MQYSSSKYWYIISAPFFRFSVCPGSKIHSPFTVLYVLDTEYVDHVVVLRKNTYLFGIYWTGIFEADRILALKSVEAQVFLNDLVKIQHD